MDINNTIICALATLVGSAYADLFSDFARNHPLILTILLTTFSLHLSYVLWGHLAVAQAPLALGLVVAAGYFAALVACVRTIIGGNPLAPST